MFARAFVFAFFAARASASAIPDYSEPWTWHLTGVTSTCTAATCYYGFNVSAPAGPSGQPGFDAIGCMGNSVQGGYKSCFVVGVDVPGDVLSQEINKGIGAGASASISVQFKYEQNGIKHLWTGSNTVMHGAAPTDLDIIPGEVFL